MRNTLAICLLFLLGCHGQVRQAEVKKTPIDVPGVPLLPQSGFEEGRLRLPSVKMFLWRPGMRNGEMSPVVAEDIVLASEVSRETARLDRQAADLAKRVDEFKPVKDERQANKKREVKKGIPALNKAIEKSTIEIDSRSASIKALDLELKTVQAAITEEEQKSMPDSARLEELKAKFAETEVKLKEENEALATATAKREEDRTRLATLEQELTTELGLGVPYRQYMNELEARIQSQEDEFFQESERLRIAGDEQVQKLVSRVDYFEYPPKLVEVDFSSAEKIHVTLKLWDPMDGRGARTFTTLPNNAESYVRDEDEIVEWESIRQVSYQARGGRVTFFVDIDRGTTFEFTFARVEENDPKGRFLMSGDVFRHRKGEMTRMGVIKLSSEKN